MRRRGVTLVGLSVVIAATAAQGATAAPAEQNAQTKPTRTPFAVPVPTQAPQADRWTTLVCHFDKAGSFNADFAASRPEAGGCFDAAKTAQPGRFGQSVFIGPEWGLLAYYGRANVNTAMGSADFWIKSAAGKNIWNDGRNHYLLSIHSAGWEAIEPILIKTAANTLMWGYLDSYDDLYARRAQIEIPCAALCADGWHHVFVSWDWRMNRFWLAINGRGYRAKGPPLAWPPPRCARCTWAANATPITCARPPTRSSTSFA